MDEGIDLSEAKRALDQFKVSRPGGGGKPPGPLDTRDADDDNEPMDARLTKLESIIPTLATKADVEGVRTDIQRGINETHRWMLGTVIGLFLGFGGLFLAMSNSLKVTAAPAGASATPAPNIIINVPPSTALTAPAK